MGKKRKHSEANVAEPPKKDSDARRGETDASQLERPHPTETKEAESSSPIFRNKEKVYRHLMLSIVSLLPHAKKDNKVESKESKGATLNELVELKNCSSYLYLWMAKCPNGPSVKFMVDAVHTMEELKLTGNHLKGSRPLLTFSTNFNKDPHWKLLKEMITQIFGTPKEHRKAKPYHDHVFAFSLADDHIWFRNYQISVPHNESDKVDRGGLDKITLVEVDPRFCLNPIKIFGSSFGGPTLYENPFYISPNEIRALKKRKAAGKYAKKGKPK
ncbi:hypothetical protein AAG906_013626 [Vitis piasezkii]